MQAFLESLGGTWAGILSVAAVGLILSLIEVSKIKINPWSAIRKWIGDFFGAEHAERINKLEAGINQLTDLLKSHIEDSNRRDADKSRRRILSFEREIQWEIKHSEEEFADVLETIQHYETYCAAHPDYKNHIAVESAAHIREVYRERLRKRDFNNGGKMQ